MSYKGVDIIKVNTTRNIPSRRLNQNATQGKEFISLIKKLFNKTNKIIEETSKETNMPEETVSNTVNENEYPTYTKFTYKQIRDMVEEKTKNLPPTIPGSLINKLRSEIEKLPQYEGNDNGGSIGLPDIPDDIIDQIVSDSTEKIHTRLEERAHIIEGLTISDQDLKEFSVILNSVGDADTRIEMLDKIGNEYRLKSLRESDARKKRLYKNISETSKLKADHIKVTEKGEKPENQEATEIIEETATNKGSIKDLTRLERFKEWAKGNLVT